jgi:hypothetical protein
MCAPEVCREPWGNARTNDEASKAKAERLRSKSDAADVSDFRGDELLLTATVELRLDGREERTATLATLEQAAALGYPNDRSALSAEGARIIQ